MYNFAEDVCRRVAIRDVCAGNYFHEYFNPVILLQGRVEYLEQTKEHFIGNYLVERKKNKSDTAFFRL